MQDLDLRAWGIVGYLWLVMLSYAWLRMPWEISQLILYPDNALTTQSRFILLDSPLIFFTALTALCFSCFTNQHEQGPSKAFKAPSWFWLSVTGLSLGATLSVKWVGLFTTAWVGSITALQLWVLLGDPDTVTPVRTWTLTFIKGILTRDIAFGSNTFSPVSFA